MDYVVDAHTGQLLRKNLRRGRPGNGPQLQQQANRRIKSDNRRQIKVEKTGATRPAFSNRHPNQGPAETVETF